VPVSRSGDKSERDLVGSAFAGRPVATSQAGDEQVDRRLLAQPSYSDGTGIVPDVLERVR
jgi:hypothetical protein